MFDRVAAVRTYRAQVRLGRDLKVSRSAAVDGRRERFRHVLYRRASSVPPLSLFLFFSSFLSLASLSLVLSLARYMRTSCGNSAAHVNEMQIRAACCRRDLRFIPVYKESTNSGSK